MNKPLSLTKMFEERILPPKAVKPNFSREYLSFCKVLGIPPVDENEISNGGIYKRISEIFNIPIHPDYSAVIRAKEGLSHATSPYQNIYLKRKILESLVPELFEPNGQFSLDYLSDASMGDLFFGLNSSPFLKLG